MVLNPRLVVTTTGRNGRGVVARDAIGEPVRPVAMPGFEFYRVWGDDGTPALPSPGQAPEVDGLFPAAGGSRFIVMRIPPTQPLSELPADFDLDGAIGELDELLPGIGAALVEMMSDGSGMHTTDTVDYVTVIEGTVELLLEDDQTVELGPGSVLVQAGNRHGWRTKGPDSALVVFAMIGAQRG